jgi:hypothetical protein
MGVDFAQTRFFDACAEVARIEGPMLALGSLTLRETEERIAGFAREHGYARLETEQSVSALIAERYGIADYISCDINGLADIDLDLSVPLAKEHRGAYRSLLNGGTLEHIFDVRQAMENIHDAVTVGGLMIHTTPMTWFDHGFYNFNPVFFHQTAEANKYEIVAEGYYFCTGTYPGQEQPFVSLNGVDEKIAFTGKTPAELFGSPALPSLVMHLVGLRKTSDARFVVPVQEAH